MQLLKRLFRRKPKPVKHDWSPATFAPPAGHPVHMDITFDRLRKIAEQMPEPPPKIEFRVSSLLPDGIIMMAPDVAARMFPAETTPSTPAED